MIEDAIRILFCDFELDADDPEDNTEIVVLLESVKDFLRKTLDEKEIWVIFYPISRIVS